MKLARRLLQASTAAAVVAALATASGSGPGAQAAPSLTWDHLRPVQQRLVSGLLAGVLTHPQAKPGGSDEGDGPDGLPDTPPSGFTGSGAAGQPGGYRPVGTGSCTRSIGGDEKVNENCLTLTDPTLQGRGQANNETSIAQDPHSPASLVASDNDYRRGDGTCGASYSSDRGRSWHDSTVPDGFTLGFAGQAREYWQAGGDTSVAYDSRGNAYLSCQLFNRGTAASAATDESSAFVVLRSTGNGGASWNFPGRYVSANYDPAGTSGVLEDKQLMTVDANASSPFRDRVYVTWTEFAADGTAYIWEAFSRDYGETFSPRVLVSRGSSLCANTFGIPTPRGSCNENQFSDPFVGSDGALYVAWANFNNAVSGQDNRNQVLLARSSDGGRSFGAPVKATDYYDLPDCQTYQGDDAGRACVPEKGAGTRSVFRATNYPVGAVDPRDPSRVVVTIGSYVNADSKESNGCAPAGFAATGINAYTGVKTAGACANHVILSVSRTAGARFTGTTTDPRSMPLVTTGAGQRHTDQFWQWVGFAPDGTLAVSYYDRQYGADETTGSSDVTLSSSRDLSTFAHQRVTSSSMPAPTEFYGTKGGLFYGDYAGLAVGPGEAHPAWSDTRNGDVFLCPGSATGPGSPPRLCAGIEPNGQLANDQDVFTDTVRLGS